MTWLKNHLRDKFLAGALAAVPVVVVIWGSPDGLGARQDTRSQGDRSH
jgi:hypothetical protein